GGRAMTRKKKTTPSGFAVIPVEPGAAPSVPADEGPTQPYVEPPVFEVEQAGGGAGSSGASWDGPTRASEVGELAALAARRALVEGDGTDAADDEAPELEYVDAEAAAEAAPPPEPAVDSAARLESIVESLLFASDRPLTVSELKRLLGERDAKKVGAALEALRERHQASGIQLASVAGGGQPRPNPQNAAWVAEL